VRHAFAFKLMLALTVWMALVALAYVTGVA
jgi:hypothetical protein